MTAAELRKRYLDFFQSKGHTVISGASLIPENDPTVLFTTAGMHPLVPYLLGEKHPAGTRLTDVQKCIRTGDIDAVGDDCHLTFFEMLGNWSLGDYFKKEAISWSYEFLTQILGFSPDRLSVTVFAGDADAPRDEEAIACWKACGIPESRIHPLPKDDNWWGPAGTTGPCGPDSEMFIDTGKDPCGPECRPGCHCGKYIEIWNDVFMQYNKTADGRYEPLKQHNVDTGMGVERTICMLQGRKTVYETELFAPLMAKIAELSTLTLPETEQIRASRIIADHIRSAVFILGDPKGGVKPGNIGANYVLRRLIRRTVRYAKLLGIPTGYTQPLAQTVIDTYADVYPELLAKRGEILNDLATEENRFEKTLHAGQNEFSKVAIALKNHGQTTLSGRTAFKLYDTYGFPLEMTQELAKEQGLQVDVQGFDEAFKKHQELSKTLSAGAFKAGLVDNSHATTLLHTATHLLHAALRHVLGPEAVQKGSNITPERLRFDFAHNGKLTPEQLKAVEDYVNDAIAKAIPVELQTMTLEDAKAQGATALFSAKYGELVKVYTIDGVSKEVCCGPHASNTSELVRFHIKKEEASSAGVRRIKAVIDAK